MQAGLQQSQFQLRDEPRPAVEAVFCPPQFYSYSRRSRSVTTAAHILNERSPISWTLRTSAAAAAAFASRCGSSTRRSVTAFRWPGLRGPRRKGFYDTGLRFKKLKT